MRLIHLSDIHIGKRVHEFSLLEDQKYILNEILNIIDNEKPDGVMIAGDIYDKSIPSVDAVQLFDDFLFSLSKRKVKVYVISGNHDSPERIAFGARLINQSGVYMSPVYNGKVYSISDEDAYGKVNIFMLPFIKPSNVKRFFPDENIGSYTDAVRIAIKNMKINKNNRNILITHQFVTGALRSESEELSVGGSDNVDAAVFDEFDYVALGHIHNSQSVGKSYIRYCGTPLKYSFSEINYEKSITIVDLKEKGKLDIKTIPLIPKRDIIEIKGNYMKITSKSFYEKINLEDYIHVILTDEEEIPDAINKLRAIYPNIMKLDYDNKRTRSINEITGIDDIENKTPIELFSEFYVKQNNQNLSSEQYAFMKDLIEKVWGTEN